jgi:hypothetical protein
MNFLKRQLLQRPISHCSQCGCPFFAVTLWEFIRAKLFGFREPSPCRVRRSIYDPL